MNTPLTTTEPQVSSNLTFSTPSHQSLSKFLLFDVEKLHLALSVDLVQKVINYTPVFGSGLSSFGVAHIDNQEITVIDLHQQFFKTSSEIAVGRGVQAPEFDSGDSPSQKGYLILTKTTIGETFALWVTQAPTLIDVSLSQIRLLPESYRRADTLGSASHVMLIPSENKTMTVFILDVDHLIT
ncbi:chemotaxis protein CheW [Chroococcus sp. FPU101]|uniref:chemotaxis protein CheW n=1 Tax=Chroococcus sp. FPU101 TaxID=1974212 RepID=UPI001A8C4EFF|nr:chemotaxis protein CheW [Chroococcus sp. FPU101]GFE70380.1 CheW protein [Chroococcus sp. FPU101]